VRPRPNRTPDSPEIPTTAYAPAGLFFVSNLSTAKRDERDVLKYYEPVTRSAIPYTRAISAQRRRVADFVVTLRADAHMPKQLDTPQIRT